MFIIKINKAIVQYLQAGGIPFGYNGISHTDSRHRRTYYVAESEKAKALLKEYKARNYNRHIENVTL